MKTSRADLVQQALMVSIERHRAMMDASVGVSAMRFNVAFDRSTGMPTKVVVNTESENFVAHRTVSTGQFTFQGDEVIIRS
jgi:hypothetical protein